jgi:hypothetical protein
MRASGGSARPSNNRPLDFADAMAAGATELYRQGPGLHAPSQDVADALIFGKDRRQDGADSGCQRQTEQQRDENESHKAAPCRKTGVVGVTASATNGSMILLSTLYVPYPFRLSILAKRRGFA